MAITRRPDAVLSLSQRHYRTEGDCKLQLNKLNIMSLECWVKGLEAESECRCFMI